MNEALKDIPDQEILRKLLSYEKESGKLFWRYRDKTLGIQERYRKTFNSQFAGREAFTALRSDGYLYGSIFDSMYLAHRVIFKLVNGEEPKCIDHVNGDRSDNRISNLRSVSRRDNQRNMGMSSANTSGFTGVCWDSANQKWRATIAVNGRQICLGRHSALEEAVKARTEANILYGFHENHGKKR